MGVPTNRLGSRATDCDAVRIALDAVPWGADRMRAPLAVAANGGSAVRH